MASEVSLIPLTPDHAPLFAKMVTQLYLDDPSSTVMTLERAAAQAERMLTEPWLAHPLLVLGQGAVVGYCVLVPFFSNEYGGTVGVVDELFIIAEQRGRGYGSQVIQAMKGWGASHGYVMLELEVNVANTRAKAFYEREGFKGLTRTLMHAKL
jgi:GNAT superfamily N-acetyltransferase